MLLWTFPSESFNLNMWTKARTESPSCAALPTSFNFPRTTGCGHLFESPRLESSFAWVRDILPFIRQVSLIVRA